jgi:hypothetical protein
MAIGFATERHTHRPRNIAAAAILFCASVAIFGHTNAKAAGPAANLNLYSIDDPVTQGVQRTFGVYASDTGGAIATSYTGTVHFTSTDPAAVLPANYTYQAGDAGDHSSFTVTWNTPGEQCLTVTDTANSALTDTQCQITVTSNQAANLNFYSIDDPITEGVDRTFGVYATNVNGEIATNYRGTVHFTSTDPAATLPTDYTYTAGDQGDHNSFHVTWRTVGEQCLTVTDIANAALTDQQCQITVEPAVAASLNLTSVDDPVAVGQGTTFNVDARTTNGEAAISYRGTVHFTSTDAAATLPADYTYVAGDNASHQFPLTWGTAGEQCLTVTDTANSALTDQQCQVTVQPASATTTTAPATTTTTAGATTTTTAGATTTTTAGATTTTSAGATTTTTTPPATTTTTAGATTTTLAATTTTAAGATTTTAAGATTTTTRAPTTTTAAGATTTTAAGGTTTTTVAGATTTTTACTAPKLTASPTTVNAGSPVTVSGTCFPADKDETIVLNSTPVTLGTAHTNSAGSFSAIFTIPSNTSAGSHTITASGTGVIASVTITVTRTGLLGVTGSNSTKVLLPFAIALAFAGLVLIAGRKLGDQNDEWAETL